MRRRPRILAVVVTQQRQVTMRGSAASARHHRQAQHQSEHGEVLNLMQPGQLRAQPEVVDLSQEPDSPHAAGRAAPLQLGLAGSPPPPTARQRLPCGRHQLRLALCGTNGAEPPEPAAPAVPTSAARSTSLAALHPMRKAATDRACLPRT